MSGVFLSYSRGDRELANSIIRGLRAVGVVVWWDEDMHSIDWNKELERQIVELATIVVLWTPNSANSDNVKDEARLGLESSKLINVIVGLPKPPFPFDRVNGLPLEGWVEHEPNNAWNRLVQSIEEKVVAKGGAAKGEFTGALARREELLKQRLHALERAQEALDEAQAREAETIEAAQAAQVTYTRAEEQHVRVMEMRATHLILSAAAQEYEAARAAKEDADRAARAAKGEVKGAQRELALAKAALEHPEEPKRGKAAPPIAAEPAAAASVAAEPVVVEPVAAQPPPAAPAVAAAVKAAEKVEPPAPKPAPEPKPAAAPGPAPAATTAPPPKPTPSPAPVPSAAKAEAPKSSGRMNLIFGGAAVILSAGIGAAVITMLNHPAANTPAKTAAAPAATKPASAAPTGDPKAAAVKAAAAIVGKWAPQGLSCDTPVVISVANGAVSMSVAGASPSTAAIGPSPDAGVINATAEDGGKYVYKLDKDNSLSMIDPNNQTMKMTKCAA
jgi:hypothetical protein